MAEMGRRFSVRDFTLMQKPGAWAFSWIDPESAADLSRDG
jgi:hypothetical protein